MASLPRAGADPLDVFPVFRGLDVLGPEWPGPALNGTRGIDRATGHLVPEDAVSPGTLDEAEILPDLADVAGRERFDRLAPELGDLLDFPDGDPDVPRC